MNDRLHFAAAGHRLLLADKNLDGVRETARLMGAAAEKAAAHALDVTSSRQVRELFASLGGQRIDVLINNAGLQHVERLEAFAEEKWDLLLDVMLKGPFLMTQAVLPGMRAAGFGRIVHIGSIHSLVASPFKSAYVAAKHGLLGLCRVVAKEGAQYNVRANVVCPGFVRTPLVDKQIPEQANELGISEEDVIKRVMLKDTVDGEFTTTGDVAAAVLFVAGFESNALTGQSLVVSHGWFME